MIAGTYSTIYVASPLEWYLANRGRAARPGKQAGPASEQPST